MPEAIDLLLTRRSVSSAFLAEPGPDDDTLERILTAATRVPDHGKLAPWRFLLFRGNARAEFGGILAKALVGANPDATDQQLAFEKGRFLRAPLIIAVISCADPHVKIPEWEQILSAGAVCINLLHAAHACGYAAQWLTEWCAYDATVRTALGLEATEKVAGFIYIGTPSIVPEDRPRPDLTKIVGDWTL